MPESLAAELARRLDLPPAQIRLDEVLAPHTSMGVGGPADYYIAPDREATIQALPGVCRELGLPLTIIGFGTNLIIADRGLRGVVAQIDQTYSGIETLANDAPILQELRAFDHPGLLASDPDASYLSVRSGTSLGQLAHYAERRGLAGLEAASGIPGSLGGAVYMNAGAYGFEMKDVVIMSRAIDPETAVVERRIGQEHGFAYRHSSYRERGAIILEILMRLRSGDREQIRAQMRDFSARRRQSQPLEYPSAGSVFKRPTGYFAGKLIADAGLQGRRVGGAEVSTKHAGFIVNRGGATADDVRDLVLDVQRMVHETYGVWLAPEIRFLGWDQDNGGISSDL